MPITDFIAFDLETTSLFAVAGQIVEIGAVRFTAAGKELDRFEQLIDPQCEITAKATAVHGITDDDVRGMPTIADVLPQFVKFLGTSDTVLLAHNASFDVSFLAAAMAKTGVEFPGHPIIDTVPVARRYQPGHRNYRLLDLAVRLGIADHEDHRALADALLLKQVFLKFIRSARDAKTTTIVLDHSRTMSFADADIYSIDPPEGFEQLGQALEEQRAIVMSYDGGTKGIAPRTVTPISLYASSETAYLVAFCHADQREKNFRLDRIKQFRLEPSQ